MSYTWQYYDLVLLGIVVSLGSGVAVGQFTALPSTTTVPVAGLVAIAIMGHGLFVNGPVDAPRDLAEEVETLN
ncbi:hypothetical protein SAMN04487950_4226 [Halogranum rubrum]|uniref:Uncharacterized protein n=2 Tax=Halogranum rubrum TaxID=553466 RepID=A0A1I4IQX7_9EURY|nr:MULTISPECIES: hypothetical protein [Halogranum]EJN57106.1 hypothetical protein HSB1_44920 [Halogranum salarium B-1]SFL56241.1 hypothetical protein SAMN04487950_4226 [Halogranum rubrum]